MASFPTLSRPPDFPVREGRIDNVIKTETDGGYQIRRARFTRVRRWWEVTYTLLTEADKVLMDTFLGTTINGGAASFTWQHPQTLESHTVYIDAPPDISLDMYSAGYRFSMTMKVVEV